MKKLLTALVVLVALGAAGVTIYRLQNAVHGGASAAAVNYLPPETLLFLSVPDLNGTAAEWKTTDLYKIWSEPEVQAFLEKPLSRLPANGQFNDTLTRIAKLEPKNLFIALTAVEEKTNRPHVVAGFEFTGASTDVDALLIMPKDQLRQHFPTGKANLLNYQGHPIETFDTGDGNMLASVYLGDWYLVGNDLKLLQSTMDRVEKRTPASDQPSLAKDADFQSVMAKLPSGHATLIFGRLQGLMKRVYDLAAASGQAIDNTQRADAEKLKAIGATTRIENGKLRDTIYCLAPGYPAPSASLQMSALPLTSVDTVLFSAGVFKLPARLDLPGDAPAGSPGAGGLGALKDLAAMLEAHGVTLAQFSAAFGNEVSLQIDWPAKSSQPKLIASLDVRDHTAADKFADSLSKTPVGEATWQISQADGLTFRTLASPGYSFVNPTLTLSDKHLILGLNPPEVHEASKRENTNAPNFTQSETYKTAAASVGKANLAFAYLDSRAFFERLYGTLKPLAMFGTALVPQVGDYVDLGKLPSTEAISKHLSPTVTSESIDGQGILFESVGSFTGGQAVVVTAGAVGAAAIPMIEKQFGGLPGMKPSSPAQPGTGE